MASYGQEQLVSPIRPDAILPPPRVVKTEEDADMDANIILAPILAFMGVMMKNRAMSWIALLLLLRALSRRGKSFSWSSFFGAFSMSAVSIGMGIITELSADAEKAAAVKAA